MPEITVNVTIPRREITAVVNQRVVTVTVATVSRRITAQVRMGRDGLDSIVPGPPGADSVVPGPPGADSVVPGPPGADSVVPGPPGADGIGTLQSVGDLIATAAEKTTPADADMFGVMDSEAGNIVKKRSWANIKATLKTYLDTLYIWTAGKAGGQTVIGGTAAGENLTLSSTSNATKGKILAGPVTIDEATGWIGIGVPPLYPVHVQKDGLGYLPAFAPQSFLNSENTTPATAGAKAQDPLGFRFAGRYWSGLSSHTYTFETGVADNGQGSNAVFYINCKRGPGANVTIFQIDAGGYFSTPIRKSNYMPGAAANEGILLVAGGSSNVGSPNQYSPYIQQEGDVWNTTTGASQQVAFRFYLTTVSGAVPTFALDWYAGFSGSPTEKVMSLSDTGVLIVNSLKAPAIPIYANNAAAVAGGLTAGAFYRTGADPDPVCVVH